MASLRIIVKVLSEILEEYILDFSLTRKDCSIIHSDLISDPVEDSSEEKTTTEESDEGEVNSDTIPQFMDDGLDTKTRRSSRTRNPPKILTFKDL